MLNFMAARNSGSFAVCIALCLPLLAAAQDGPVLGPMHAFVNYEIGQIEQGKSSTASGIVDREMISHASVWTLQEARLADNAKVVWGLGAIYFFVFPRNLGGNPYAHSKRSAVGLTNAYGEFDFGKRGDDDHLLRLTTGVFGYKYNPDAKNLGEYMFRTWTYPNLINTGGLEFVNSAAAQLSGFSGNTRLGGLNNDLLLTLETDRPPVFGLSLTDIVSYDFGGLVTLGAGVMWNNFYNPDDRQISPTDQRNSYYTLSTGRQIAASRYEYELQNGIVTPGEMVRGAVNFGKLIPGIADMLSPEDLRLYGEAILLGIKDYPTYYEKVQDRMVYMVGLNLPTFRLIDLLSVELEYASNPFDATTGGSLEQSSVTPFLDAGQWGSYKPVRGDDVKWTIFARKDIYNGLSIYGQAARDHIRMVDVFSTPDKTEFLPERNNWYWALKLAYSI
jgi:hypothetical protein